MRIRQLIFPLVIAAAIVGAAMYLIFPQFLSEPTSVERVLAHPEGVIQKSIKAVSRSQPNVRFAPGRQQDGSRQIAYKWVDEQGQTHYGDQPNVVTEDVEVNAVYSDPMLNVIRSSNEATLSESRQRTYRTQRPSKRYHADASRSDSDRMDTENSYLCQQAENRLDRIKSRMRAGYKLKEADRLHRKELTARKDRRRYCR